MSLYIPKCSSQVHYNVDQTAWLTFQLQEREIYSKYILNRSTPHIIKVKQNFSLLTTHIKWNLFINTVL